MRRTAILFGILLPCAVVCAPTGRAPILVELFTSEGCSSCPPADKFLQQLDPRVVVLSEHVDYWDHDGWKDPNSSHELTLRQEDYAARFDLSGPYTPEMVVDGSAEFNGSDVRKASQVLAQQSEKPKADIRLARGDGGVEIHIADPPINGDVMLAVTEDHFASDVRAGENKGRHIESVAIVRSMRKVGSARRGAAFATVARLPKDSAGARLVVFLQQSGTGPVAGAAELGPN